MARKVVHVVAPAHFGGAESVVQGLVLGARRRGADVRVAALLQDSEPNPSVERLRAGGVPVTQLRCGRRAYRAEVRELADLLRRDGATVAHTHVYHADVVGWRAARRAGIPVVATVHGYTRGDLKNRFYEWLDKRVLRRFDAVICVADTVREELLAAGVKPHVLHTIPNGFVPAPVLAREKARAALNLPLDAPAVGWVGRLSHEKAPDRFVAALDSAALPGLTGVLIGDGPERVGLETLIASRPTESARVILAGFRENAATLLSAFDALVVSSRTEGLPIVLLEAIAAGVPVVSFDIGAVPDLLRDGAGWLVPEGDVTALGAALADALTRQDEAARRAARARAVLDERFGLDRWLDAVAEVYRKVEEKVNR